MPHLLILKENNIGHVAFNAFQASSLLLLDNRYSLAVFKQTENAYCAYFVTDTDNLPTLNVFSRPLITSYMKPPENLTRGFYFGNGVTPQGGFKKITPYPLSVYQSVLFTHLSTATPLAQVWAPVELNVQVRPNCESAIHKSILALVTSHGF